MTSNPLSEKQRNFIDRLFNDVQENSDKLSEQDSEEAGEKLKPVVPQITSLKKGNDISKADASQVIDVLMGLNKFIEEKLNIIHCRWKKLDNDWLVVGPESVVVPGATVTVKSSKGEKEVDIDSVVKTEDGKAWGTVKKEELDLPDNISEGIWRNTNEELIEVYKTRKGFLVAKHINSETGEKTYLGKAGLKNLHYKLSLEEAKLWGKETGICCRCSRKLTKPESIERGMGDWCANNWGQ